MDRRGGGCITFLRRNFLSHLTEILRKGPFSVRQNFGYRKFFCMRGISRLSVRGGGGGGSTIFL